MDLTSVGTHGLVFRLTTDVVYQVRPDTSAEHAAFTVTAHCQSEVSAPAVAIPCPQHSDVTRRLQCDILLCEKLRSHLQRMTY